MRTADEIKRQVEGLKNERSQLPEHSAFGDPNHLGIDAQIAIIEGRTTSLDYEDDESFEDEGQAEYIRGQVETAEAWLEMECDDDLYSE